MPRYRGDICECPDEDDFTCPENQDDIFSSINPAMLPQRAVNPDENVLSGFSEAWNAFSFLADFASL